MLFEEKIIDIKGGKATLRAPKLSDAQELIEYLIATAGETDFLIRTPQDICMTVEQEERFLQRVLNSPDDLMIVCEVDGKIAGNCSLMFMNKEKMRHRANVGIALLQEFWNRGIGTQMFVEMEKAAREKGVRQMELEVQEGNERAMHLYEKMGFRFVGHRPDAFMMKDGTLLKEYFMQKLL